MSNGVDARGGRIGKRAEETTAALAREHSPVPENSTNQPSDPARSACRNAPSGVRWDITEAVLPPLDATDRWSRASRRATSPTQVRHPFAVETPAAVAELIGQLLDLRTGDHLQFAFFTLASLYTYWLNMIHRPRTPIDDRDELVAQFDARGHQLQREPVPKQPRARPQ